MKVNSSAITARQPEVPNLIWVVMTGVPRVPCAVPFAFAAPVGVAYYEPAPWRGEFARHTPAVQRLILYDRQESRPDNHRLRRGGAKDRPCARRRAPGRLRQHHSENRIDLPLAGQARRGPGVFTPHQNYRIRFPAFTGEAEGVAFLRTSGMHRPRHDRRQPVLSQVDRRFRGLKPDPIAPHFPKRKAAPSPGHRRIKDPASVYLPRLSRRSCRMSRTSCLASRRSACRSLRSWLMSFWSLRRPLRSWLMSR